MSPNEDIQQSAPPEDPSASSSKPRPLAEENYGALRQRVTGNNYTPEAQDAYKERGKPEKKPAIRTMKSDIDELMKGGRLTLGQMVGPGVNNFYKTTRSKRYLVFIGVILIAALSVSVWILTRPPKEPEDRPQRPSAPAPLFAAEASRTITVKYQDRLQFFRLLEDSMKEQELFGTVKRIIVKIQIPDLPDRRAGGSERFATFADFVDFYRLTPPKNLTQFLGGPLMVFIYYGENGSRLGLAAKTSDFDRTMLSMFSWESSLALDFRQLFFGVQFGETTGEFEDRTYRNIDWRFLKSLRTEDLGIGYTIFPARDVLVITTSKEALEKAIDKLFEAK